MSIPTDADMEAADYASAARRAENVRAAGECPHLSTVGYVGRVFYPAQEGLTPGQVRCTDGCGRVFASDEEWLEAMTEAMDY